MEKQEILLSAQGIVKRYPGVVALDHVDLDFYKGEIHAICGENGAGKSTFIKVLTGAIQPDAGRIEMEGIHRDNYTPHEAMFNYGISAIYQEFYLIPALTIAENLFLGKEIMKNRLLDRKTMNSEAKALLLSLGVDLDPNRPVGSLSVAYQQIVEIAKSTYQNAKLIIMDEPSAPLTINEVDKLFNLVHTLKAKGITVIYISHRLTEIFELSDRVTVFRDGKKIVTMPTSSTTKNELIHIMVNRELSDTFPTRKGEIAEPILEVKNLSTAALLQDISFTLHKGEVLGFGGLVGAGRTELARAIYGADPITEGTILIKGKEMRIRHPKEAVAQRIGLIPEDRKQHGILSRLSVGENIAYSSFSKISRFCLIQMSLMNQSALKMVKMLRIITPNTHKRVQELSGGNQQKVVLARWLVSDCEIILFDEPTRGIDVGAKQEIYELIFELAAQGKAIILISSEMNELLGMSDRILVMHEGVITGELSRAEATQDKVLRLASGE
ncbi:MAG: sugar ABC transporter ATP-binding protein [Sphaerochaeta sp.]|nr:sugar ABC transporter ATP-binding protein [Sphaerochaeta sp.]